MALDDQVEVFAGAVGTDDPVTIAGSGSRGGAVVGVRTVSAPVGIEWIQPAEMTLRCGAGTPVDDLDAALEAFGQCVAIPSGGTIGGALAVGRSGIRRLGWGPVRDTVLQVRYVSAGGDVVKVGGPTVKNVSGFDLCRLLVGSRGTLGFLAEVILRTRPRPLNEQWFESGRDPWVLLRELYRPTSVLWNGETSWVLLEGHTADIERQAQRSELVAAAGHPPLPPHRRSLPPAELGGWREHGDMEFIAEIGIGIVHTAVPAVAVAPSAEVVALHRRIKHEFDPLGRLNPGVDVLHLDR